MEAEVLGWVAAVLAVVRSFIAVAQKEFISLLTTVGVFLLGIAVAVGAIKV